MESFENKQNIFIKKEEEKEIENPGKLIVPEAEISERFSRSGGKGGQNVNKLSTKAEARWNVDASQEFTPGEKEKIRQFLKNDINEEGDLIVTSREERSQSQNRKRAFEKLNNKVAAALTPEKERIPTKPTRASKERRLEEKKKMGEKKKWRSKKEYD